jgi:hypothetical protein
MVSSEVTNDQCNQSFTKLTKNYFCKLSLAYKSFKATFADKFDLTIRPNPYKHLNQEFLSLETHNFTLISSQEFQAGAIVICIKK